MKMKYAVLAVMMIGLVLGGSGCQKGGGESSISAGNSAGEYSVANYKEMELIDGGRQGWLRLTVKGPAADLAVVLVPPNGEPSSVIIDKKQMIANSHTVGFGLSKEDLSQPGDCVLMLKTVNPEKVVWKQKINYYVAVHPSEVAAK